MHPSGRLTRSPILSTDVNISVSGMVACAEYETARDRRSRASRVKQERPNSSTSSVANPGPGQRLTVEIEYRQALRYQDAAVSVRYPSVTGPRHIPGSPQSDTGAAGRRAGLHPVCAEEVMSSRARTMRLPGPVYVSIWQAGEAAYVRAKAGVAQRLIALAWDRSLARGARVKPWPWADTYPVARLEAPRQGAALMVLAGAGGRTLAFGPGHVDGTPLPGDAGNCVVSGHRDTHFAFLRELRAGDTLLVQCAGGRMAHYTVAGIEVVRKRDIRVLLDVGDDRLTLVTCYPFDRPIPGGSLRYVVVATRTLSPAL